MRIGPSGRNYEFNLFEEKVSYWNRLIIEVSDSEKNVEAEKFYFELKSFECNAGLKLVDNNETCPIMELKMQSVDDVKTILLILKNIINGRKQQIMNKKNKSLEIKS